MRGIILSGGRGTRLAPQTEIQNKHLLPVYTNQGAIPMIWYPLHTLVKSGCKDILIISSQEHCGDIIEFLGDGNRFDCSITYKIQDHNNPQKPVGIASALALAKDFVQSDPFAVILGDNFYQDTFNDIFKQFSQNVYANQPSAQIFLKQVPDPERFGVAYMDDKNQITQIVEKPKNPTSNYAVTGLYLYTSHVFSLIPTLKVSNRGELEVSDINDWYVKNKTMSGHVLPGYWSDMGIPSSMHRTIDFINNINYRLDFK